MEKKEVEKMTNKELKAMEMEEAAQGATEGRAMRAQEKLVKFMEGKQEKLAGYSYFTSKDAEFLLSLKTREASKYWKLIVEAIIDGWQAGLTPDLCPFCLYAERHKLPCADCQYARNHGVACSRNNTIQAILENDAGILENQFYIDLIKGINERKRRRR